MSGAELLLVVVVTLAGSFIKSVTGMGYPLVAVPVLSLVLDVETAVVVVALPNTAANLALNLDARESRHETRDLPVLLLSSVAFTAIGTLVLVEAPERPLLLGLAATVLLFVVQFLRTPHLRLAPATTRRWAPVAGAVTGFSQGAVGVSGPLVAMWFHGYRLSKDAYVHSVTALFLVSGATQAVVLLVDGRFDRDRWIATGFAFVATFAVMPLGTRLRYRLAGPTFERLVLSLVAASGVSLVVQAFT